MEYLNLNAPGREGNLGDGMILRLREPNGNVVWRLPDIQGLLGLLQPSDLPGVWKVAPHASPDRIRLRLVYQKTRHELWLSCEHPEYGNQTVEERVKILDEFLAAAKKKIHWLPQSELLEIKMPDVRDHNKVAA